MYGNLQSDRNKIIYIFRAPHRSKLKINRKSIVSLVGVVVSAPVNYASDPCLTHMSGWFLKCENRGSQSIQVFTLAK